jgi:hypothetical protein
MFGEQADGPKEADCCLLLSSLLQGNCLLSSAPQNEERGGSTSEPRPRVVESL